MQEDSGQNHSFDKKRKAVEDSNSAVNASGKRTRKSRSQSETGETVKAEPQWPDYFKEALNTVLAFCTSRKQFATSFNSLRTSIESLLKRPLELEKVAEIKALLPELLTFAYIPANHLKFNGTSQQTDLRKDIFADYAGGTRPIPYDENEHVLVLEMDDSMVRKRKSPFNLQLLIEKRNAIFSKAVDELIEAFSDAEDPVALLAHGAGELPHIPDPENRQPIAGIVEELQEQKWYMQQIKYRRTFDAKEGSLGTPSPPLSETTKAALRDARKITTLYTHQTSAIAALSNGKDVIVSTSTASGKSVIYQVPLLRMLEEDKGTKALFIYPTKALAQDQRAALEQLLACCPGLESIFVSTYDGDTPQDVRASIRDTASVLFTNIDTIHASILPHEERWRRFLKNLKLVVLDELHYYHDMFGSNVALVMRRLRRICAAVGNRRIRFVSCSATISRPKEHMKAIFGLEDVEAVTEDGAPSGKKEFLLWGCSSSSKADPISESTRIMSYLMKRGIRVILYELFFLHILRLTTRWSMPIGMKTLRNNLSMEQRYDVLNKLSTIGAAQIEQEAFSGRILGLVATNALELGVDIGVLDAVIVCEFPVSLSSFRQQIGRAGRRARDSLAIFVAGGEKADDHYVTYPDDLFDKPTPELIVNLESELVIEAHLQCAALNAEGWFHTHPKHLPYPASGLSIRGADEEKYTVIDVSATEFGVKGLILEETEISRALFELYEGAISLPDPSFLRCTHVDRKFQVREINHDSKQARLIRTDVDWLTRPRDVDPIQTWRIREIKDSPRRALYGSYHKIRGQTIIDTVWVDMPPYENTTTGMWIDVSKEALDILGGDAAAAIHAAAHAFLNQFPMAGDLRTECPVPQKEMTKKESSRKRPGRTGGVAAKAFDHSDIRPSLSALETVSSCDCVDEGGCENCTTSSLCRKGNEVSSKRGASVVLRDILGLPLGEAAPEEDMAYRPLTVVEAQGVGVAEGVVVEKPDA
ncbi:P-loop containing nucleoside triphosphate hydrolase protein [Russula aff. rugulosa BPL654]|nr:P-loop containing nucleoside triphosphate hydrolase protein [Russula aff. rugulosa BPL654]